VPLPHEAGRGARESSAQALAVTALMMTALRSCKASDWNPAAGAVADVEQPSGTRIGRQREVVGPVGDVVMQAAELAVFAGGGSGFEGGAVAILVAARLTSPPHRFTG
jgi:hypothetical protein